MKAESAPGAALQCYRGRAGESSEVAAPDGQGAARARPGLRRIALESGVAGSHVGSAVEFAQAPRVARAGALPSRLIERNAVVLHYYLFVSARYQPTNGKTGFHYDCSCLSVA
jgi:hypothetical protein